MSRAKRQRGFGSDSTRRELKRTVLILLAIGLIVSLALTALTIVGSMADGGFGLTPLVGGVLSLAVIVALAALAARFLLKRRGSRRAPAAPIARAAAGAQPSVRPDGLFELENLEISHAGGVYESEIRRENPAPSDATKPSLSFIHDTEPYTPERPAPETTPGSAGMAASAPSFDNGGGAPKSERAAPEPTPRSAGMAASTPSFDNGGGTYAPERPAPEPTLGSAGMAASTPSFDDGGGAAKSEPALNEAAFPATPAYRVPKFSDYMSSQSNEPAWFQTAIGTQPVNLDVPRETSFAPTQQVEEEVSPTRTPWIGAGTPADEPFIVSGGEVVVAVREEEEAEGEFEEEAEADVKDAPLAEASAGTPTNGFGAALAQSATEAKDDTPANVEERVPSQMFGGGLVLIPQDDQDAFAQADDEIEVEPYDSPSAYEAPTNGHSDEFSQPTARTEDGAPPFAAAATSSPIFGGDGALLQEPDEPQAMAIEDDPDDVADDERYEPDSYGETFVLSDEDATVAFDDDDDFGRDDYARASFTSSASFEDGFDDDDDEPEQATYAAAVGSASSGAGAELVDDGGEDFPEPDTESVVFDSLPAADNFADDDDGDGFPEPDAETVVFDSLPTTDSFAADDDDGFPAPDAETVVFDSSPSTDSFVGDDGDGFLEPDAETVAFDSPPAADNFDGDDSDGFPAPDAETVVLDSPSASDNLADDDGDGFPEPDAESVVFVDDDAPEVRGDGFSYRSEVAQIPKKANRFWDMDADAGHEPSAPSTLWPVEPSIDEPAAPAATPERPSSPVNVVAPMWRKPSVRILDTAPVATISEEDVEATSSAITRTLAEYGVEVEVEQVRPGPTVTMYGLAPGWIRKYKNEKQVDDDGVPLKDERGRMITKRVEDKTRVRVDSIIAREKDLSLALQTASIRIETPAMGKSLVGIEVPNPNPSLVTLRSIMEGPEFKELKETAHLPIALGQGSGGEAVVFDLAKMPHLLVAGATGSGKSVCLNAIVSCLITEKTPEDVRLLLVDPKRVELTPYNGIPHLMAPVVVETDTVVGFLKGLIREMFDRYRQMEEVGVRNIEAYNERMPTKMPFLCVVIDELADLMMTASFDVEQSLCRLAQLGRATGIHMIIATQRPSVDVLTGLIKANFPSRISFGVTSQVDSRTILDTAGADKLLGRGDMLYMPLDASKPSRVQSVFIGDSEIEKLVGFWQSTPWPAIPEIDLLSGGDEMVEDDPDDDDDHDRDEMIDKAIELAMNHRKLSTSLLQRRLRIGYPRAARLMDQLEEEGIVGPGDGARSRDVIINQD